MDKKHVLLMGVENPELADIFSGFHTQNVSSFTHLFYFTIAPDLIVFDKIAPDEIERIRQERLFARIPVCIVCRKFDDINAVASIENVPNVLMCNLFAAKENDFQKRIQLLVKGKKPLVKSKTAQIVRYGIWYINENFQKNITRELISQRLGVSEDYLSRIFLQETGISLWHYVNLCRVDYAVSQLKKTDADVKKIALQSGFSDSSYFIKVFKKITTQTPTQFRTKVSEK